MELHHHAQPHITPSSARFFNTKILSQIGQTPGHPQHPFSIGITQKDPVNLLDISPAPAVSRNQLIFSQFYYDMRITAFWLQEMSTQDVTRFRVGDYNGDGSRVFFEREDLESEQIVLHTPVAMSVRIGKDLLFPELQVCVDLEHGTMWVKDAQVLVLQGNTRVFELVGFSVSYQIVYTCQEVLPS